MMKVPLHTCIIVFICTTLQYMDFILSSQNFGKCRKSFKTLSMERGLKVDPFYAFESPVSLNVYQCAELCLRRKLCKSSSFLADQDICLLNSVVLSDLNAVNDVNAVYIHKNDNEAVSIFLLDIVAVALLVYYSILYTFYIVYVYGWPSYSQLIIFTSSKNIFTSSKNIFTGSRNKTLGTCKLRNGKNEKKRKETERKKTKRKQGEK